MHVVSVQLVLIDEEPQQFALFTDVQTAYRTTVYTFLILNCCTCLHGLPCNSICNLFPPTLEEYLPLDEELQLYEHN
jgi:hypothetical protein